MTTLTPVPPAAIGKGEVGTVFDEVFVNVKIDQLVAASLAVDRTVASVKVLVIAVPRETLVDVLRVSVAVELL